MGNWVEKKVKELCIIGRGRVISQGEINSNPGIYPVFSSQTANNGEMGKIESYDFDGEYVTWTTDGANAGTVFYRSGKFNCTNVCGTLKEMENDSLDLRFFSYLLSTEAKKHVSYVGNPKLMNGVMADVKLNLPESKSEQTRIAEILSTADEAIAHTESLIAKYQRLKIGLMQDLLTKGIDENGNIRSKETHKFVVKNGIEVPEEWEVDDLEKVCSKITDGSHFSPIPQVEGRIIGNVKDMTENGFNLLSCTRILEKDFQILKLQNCSPKRGDVLLSKDGTIGRVLFYDSDLEIVILSSIAILRAKTDYDGNYLSYLLKSEFFKTQLFTLESGSALKRIVLKDIRAMKFPFPNKIEEQTLISKQLSHNDELIQNIKNQFLKLQSLKTGLMQDLLSGKVRVKI